MHDRGSDGYVRQVLNPFEPLLSAATAVGRRLLPRAPSGPLTRGLADRLIAQGEGQHVEFKETTGTLKAAIKTLAAFASQPGGGYVFIGVKDDGRPNKGFQLGARTVEEVAAEIKSKTLSMVSAEPLLPRLWAFENPALLVLEVVRDSYKGGPYLAHGARWQRSGKSTHRIDMDYVQLARAYQAHLWDDESEEHLAFRFCERCGSKSLERGTYTDFNHDRLYHWIKCTDCSWGDWSE